MYHIASIILKSEINTSVMYRCFMTYIYSGKNAAMKYTPCNKIYSNTVRSFFMNFMPNGDEEMFSMSS